MNLDIFQCMTVPDQQEQIVDNVEDSRFELRLGAQRAISQYTLRNGVMTFTHTEVPPELEGQGIGGRIARFALDQARARGLQVVPRCPFIANFISRHPEYADLVWRAE